MVEVVSNVPNGKQPKPTVYLACVDIQRFRRLNSVRIPIDADTTILVGANNSGKTSALVALRQFLSTKAFGAHDLSVDAWQRLRELGEAWESLDKDPATDTFDLPTWNQYLDVLLKSMPTLDLWFIAEPGAFHVVSSFLPSLKWKKGPIGVRLRVEPASDIPELQALAWQYREARRPIRDLPSAAKSWPTDLLDYWLRNSSSLERVKAYKLDPNKGPLAETPNPIPQELVEKATALDPKLLAPLIRVDFIAAQRGLGSEEADGRPGKNPHQIGLFSNQMLRFVRDRLNNSGSGPSTHPELVAAVAKAQGELDTQLHTALEPSIKDVKRLGYTAVHDPQEIHFRTRIQTGDLLDHNTAIQYRLGGQPENVYLPEHAIGLGYQNLQSLSYQLVSFREGRLKPETGVPAAVHLVLVEEPEAHLHVQVQRIFPTKALGLIRSNHQDHAELATQLVLSTHASHLAHAESLTRLRYVRRRKPRNVGEMPYSEVVNLADVFGDDKETQLFAERYFQIQHTDLLFADAAIFVEGTAERMLVPLFLEKDFPELSKMYLSFLDVGGSHVHRLKPLIERLGIPAVVITDIDPVIEAKSAKNKTVWKAVPITNVDPLECGNDSLNKWHPGKRDLKEYIGLGEAEKIWTSTTGSRVRFAWQNRIEPGSLWPSSFEDAFIITNLDWFKKHTDESGLVGRAAEEVEGTAMADLPEALHALLRKSFDKGEFATCLFGHLVNEEPLLCPSYISEALAWLEKELAPLVAEGQS